MVSFLKNENGQDLFMSDGRWTNKAKAAKKLEKKLKLNKMLKIRIFLTLCISSKNIKLKQSIKLTS